MIRIPLLFACLIVNVVASIELAHASDVWNPMADKNHYRNPVIHADYSDPDLIKVGDDFYMTASSLNLIPGLPILHSRDLVHWEIVSYALPDDVDRYFDVPRHRKGVWAPSFHYHDGTFYIF